jgi:sec-independent protein translocase protein TatA
VPNVGVSELIVIVMILLLVFGGSRLPQIGESLGRTVRGFKRAFDDDESAARAKSPPTDPEPGKLPPSHGSSSVNDEISDAEIVDKKS